jgi:hypothetical protein
MFIASSVRTDSAVDVAANAPPETPDKIMTPPELPFVVIVVLAFEVLPLQIIP